MEAGLAQGITPLVQTPVEKIRVVRLKEYNLIRSFVESSLRQVYVWRTAMEYPWGYMWRKPNRWELEVYKYNNAINVEKLPVGGIFKVVTNEVKPAVVLRSLKSNDEIWFILIPNIIGANELGILYDNDIVKLAITRWAPVMFMPSIPVPFSRPIPIYEVFETLDYYFTL
jgi:hypothetical protein